MSAEAFETILSLDVRTAPDGRNIEYAPVGSGTPRWVDEFGPDGVRLTHSQLAEKYGEDYRPWISTRAFAENAIRLAAQAIAQSDPQEGLSDPMTQRCQHLAAVLEACADATRVLALDLAGDAACSDEKWQQALRDVWDQLMIPPAVPEPATQG